MNFDIFDETDSWDTLVENGKVQSTTKLLSNDYEQKAIQSYVNNNVKSLDEVRFETTQPVATKQMSVRKKCLMVNITIPLAMIVIGVLLMFCFNIPSTDHCGCPYDPNLDNNPLYGDVYFNCVIEVQRWEPNCYSSVKYG